MQTTFTYRKLPRSFPLEGLLRALLERYAPRRALAARVVLARDGRAPTIHCQVWGPGWQIALQENGSDLYEAATRLGHHLQRFTRRRHRGRNLKPKT